MPCLVRGSAEPTAPFGRVRHLSILAVEPESVPESAALPEQDERKCRRGPTNRRWVGLRCDHRLRRRPDGLRSFHQLAFDVLGRKSRGPSAKAEFHQPAIELAFGSLARRTVELVPGCPGPSRCERWRQACVSQQFADSRQPIQRPHPCFRCDALKWRSTAFAEYVGSGHRERETSQRGRPIFRPSRYRHASSSLLLDPTGDRRDDANGRLQSTSCRRCVVERQRATVRQTSLCHQKRRG